jgi:hypothetical protein
MTTTFAVSRADLRRTHWVETAAAALPEGAVRLRIECFALTANNVTYAAFGDTMNYWAFYPTGDVGTGCIPVWGFARVVESDCPEVGIGERFYGYLPMATDVVLVPTKCTAAGFVDGAGHRRELPAVYNHYLRCSTDPAYDPSREAEQALLRPLFTTSFLIDDFLADNADFGATDVLLSSASSKTAYGTAFCLARRRGTPRAVKIVGLTSPANVEFVRGLGCYDEIRAYDEVASMDPAQPSIYVDFSGSVALRSAVHQRFGDALAYSCSVGGTHWDELGSGKGLPGPRPTLFFAPAQVKKRLADWGGAEFQRRLAEAWNAFLRIVTDARQPWLRVERGAGSAALEQVYAALLDGRSDPRAGHVLTL